MVWLCFGCIQWFGAFLCIFNTTSFSSALWLKMSNRHFKNAYRRHQEQRIHLRVTRSLVSLVTLYDQIYHIIICIFIFPSSNLVMQKYFYKSWFVVINANYLRFKNHKDHFVIIFLNKKNTNRRLKFGINTKFHRSLIDRNNWLQFHLVSHHCNQSRSRDSHRHSASNFYVRLTHSFLWSQRSSLVVVFCFLHRYDWIEIVVLCRFDLDWLSIPVMAIEQAELSNEQVVLIHYLMLV